MNIDKARSELSLYGAVKTCKVVNESVVTIVLTEWFKASNTLKLIKLCGELFPDHKTLETGVTEDGLAIIILTK